MPEINQEELTLLAAMAYGESYYKENDFEEMAGIAAVLLRQRDSRGYSTMQDFTKSEPTYSFVVRDGNPRYGQLIGTTESQITEESSNISTQREDIEKNIQSLHTKAQTETSRNNIEALNKKIKINKNKLKSIESAAASNAGKVMAYRAARHALEGGVDYSGGAYFWDGWDIKTNYKNHPKVKRGIKITDPAHNIFDIKDNLVTIIKYKVVTTTKAGKKTQEKQEIGRYDHVYESTAGHGGTIFWKFNPEYANIEHAKDYK
ncbi:hypothetical protein [Ideonella oryzae]|uniref:Uncharacterized protein n=1 Tax=Ideonella oryzae TaxID=2937441 RepID=A0ABT1BRU4_9BURK|nr:hypothetical protein [Ideonella oryzae]MCO5978117.1 hypothetical protein [Ideonella oryzae]